MLNKINKILCLILVLTTILSIFSGCGAKKKVVLSPEKQLFKDEYENNKEITKSMQYSIDYITSSNKSIGKMESLNLFEMINIQVDNWPCFIIGKSSLGEIVKIIDDVNAEYVKTKTNSIIAERQKEIDDEYNKKAKSATDKGKEYKKEKKKVRTDDIKIEKPYEYTVTLGTGNKAVTEEFKPTFLVDSLKTKIIILNISKYGIPYITIDFTRYGSVYNTRITQESDWVSTGIVAADVTTFVLGDKKTQKNNAKKNVEIETPNYFDTDGRNKAAKKNIRMSGDISFGGEGFTWDSLLTFCKALNLGEKQSKNSYKQTSDDKFAYYTISLYTNPTAINEKAFSTDSVTFPVVTLTATFDKMTQICLNWDISMCKVSPVMVSGKMHDVSNIKDVNVHEYTVDTNNYDNKCKSINQWILEHSIGTLKYCAFDTDKNNKKNGFLGVVETGLNNVTIEPIINKVTYSCIEASVNNDGSVAGKYISADDKSKANGLEEPKKSEYIISHTKNLKIAPCLIDDKSNVVCNVVDNAKEMIGIDGEKYNVALFEKEGNEYKNVAVLSYENCNKLLMLYIKTFDVTYEQNEKIKEIYESNGLMSVKDYIKENFESQETEASPVEAEDLFKN